MRDLSAGLNALREMGRRAKAMEIEGGSVEYSQIEAAVAIQPLPSLTVIGARTMAYRIGDCWGLNGQRAKLEGRKGVRSGPL
jgi:hypothetical protein